VQQLETSSSMKCRNTSLSPNHVWGSCDHRQQRTMWTKLPDDIKEIMARNFEEAAKEGRAAILADSKHTLDVLKSQGMAVTEPDLESFRDSSNLPITIRIGTRSMGDKVWDALEQVVGTLS